MTIVAGIVVGGGTPFDSVFLAADSRVNFSSELSPGKLSSKTDKAQKIRVVGGSLIIGYAGDYYNANRVLDSLTEDVFGSSPGTIADVIGTELRRQWMNKTYEDTSFYVAVPFFLGAELKWRLHIFDSPEFQPVELQPGVHVMGMDAITRSKFKERYTEVSMTTNASTFDAHYCISLLSAFEEVASTEVGGIVTIAIMDANGCRFQNYAASKDHGGNWVAVSSGKNGSFRMVNGKPFGHTTATYKQLMDDRNKRFDV